MIGQVDYEWAGEPWRCLDGDGLAADLPSCLGEPDEDGRPTVDPAWVHKGVESVPALWRIARKIYGLQPAVLPLDADPGDYGLVDRSEVRTELGLSPRLFRDEIEKINGLIWAARRNEESRHEECGEVAQSDMPSCSVEPDDSQSGEPSCSVEPDDSQSSEPSCSVEPDDSQSSEPPAASTAMSVEDGCPRYESDPAVPAESRTGDFPAVARHGSASGDDAPPDPPVKRGRGRPRTRPPLPKRPRGRPRKEDAERYAAEAARVMREWEEQRRQRESAAAVRDADAPREQAAASTPSSAA